MDEAELPEAEYQQKRRLHDLAKAHTAQLMAKMDDLPPEERQAFLQTQVFPPLPLGRTHASGTHCTYVYCCHT